MANKTWLDYELGEADKEVQTWRGKETVERYLQTINDAWNAFHRDYNRLFVLRFDYGAGMLYKTERLVQFAPTRLETKAEDCFIHFFNADENGVGVGPRDQAPLTALKAIGVLEQPLRFALEPARLGEYEGECVLVEFNLPLDGLRVPVTSLHGVYRHPPQGENLWETPDHDYEGVRKSNGIDTFPHIGIAAVTLCPHTHKDE